MGEVPYPTFRNGLDLRKNRARLLKAWESKKKSPLAKVNSGNHGG
jgi:hypothetical protein